MKIEALKQELKKILRPEIKAIILAERERNARIVESVEREAPGLCAELAARIRAG
jgi:hypothetical protein